MSCIRNKTHKEGQNRQNTDKTDKTAIKETLPRSVCHNNTLFLNSASDYCKYNVSLKVLSRPLPSGWLTCPTPWSTNHVHILIKSNSDGLTHSMHQDQPCWCVLTLTTNTNWLVLRGIVRVLSMNYACTRDKLYFEESSLYSSTYICAYVCVTFGLDRQVNVRHINTTGLDRKLFTRHIDIWTWHTGDWRLIKTFGVNIQLDANM